MFFCFLLSTTQKSEARSSLLTSKEYAFEKQFDTILPFANRMHCHKVNLDEVINGSMNQTRFASGISLDIQQKP